MAEVDAVAKEPELRELDLENGCGGAITSRIQVSRNIVKSKLKKPKQSSESYASVPEKTVLCTIIAGKRRRRARKLVLQY